MSHTVTDMAGLSRLKMVILNLMIRSIVHLEWPGLMLFLPTYQIWLKYVTKMAN